LAGRLSAANVLIVVPSGALEVVVVDPDGGVRPSTAAGESEYRSL